MPFYLDQNKLSASEQRTSDKLQKLIYNNAMAEQF
jgi:hypothetical protein